MLEIRPLRYSWVPQGGSVREQVPRSKFWTFQACPRRLLHLEAPADPCEVLTQLLSKAQSKAPGPALGPRHHIFSPCDTLPFRKLCCGSRAAFSSPCSRDEGSRSEGILAVCPAVPWAQPVLGCMNLDMS